MNTDRDTADIQTHDTTDPDSRPGGAPLKLTLERQTDICDAIRAGVRPETAAMYCGIGARTYYRWMAQGRAQDAEQCFVQFVEQVELALAEWEARDTLLIGEAAKTDWRAAAWGVGRRLAAGGGGGGGGEIADAGGGRLPIPAGA